MGTDTLETQLTLFPEHKNIILDSSIETQECKTCKKVLPLRSYSIKNVYSDNLGVLSKNCKSCCNKINKEHYERKAGIPYPDKDYKCPICLRNEEELQTKQTVVDIETYKVTEHRMKRKNVWRLDHDHNTGKVRGWICNSCNISMGQLDDDIDTLKRAVNYLEENNDKG